MTCSALLALALAGCGGPPHAQDAAERLAGAYEQHDPGALAELLQGHDRATAGRLIEAADGFSPEGEPVVAGEGDSSSIRCVWLRGQADGDRVYIVGQLLLDSGDTEWTVLPAFLPGGDGPDTTPCGGAPDAVDGLSRFAGSGGS